MSAPKIDVNQARHDVETSDTLLVCAYEDQDKLASNHLHGAIPLDESRSNEDELSKQRELVFYYS